MGRRSGWFWNLFLVVLGAILGAILAVLAPAGWEWLDPPNPRQPITITQPRPPVRGRLHTIRGTVSFPSNQPLTLWIVVQGLSGGGRGGFWPQGAVIGNPDQTNAWSCAIALGSPDEREVGRYKIWAVLAGPGAHAAFSKFVRTKLLQGSDIPMENWPAEVIRSVSIEVNRRSVAHPKYTSRGVKVSDNDRRRPAYCEWPPPGAATHRA